MDFSHLGDCMFVLYGPGCGDQPFEIVYCR